MADPAPLVSVSFDAGPENSLHASGVRCGLAVAPREDGRFTLSAMGTDVEVLQMALAVFDYARLCGLEVPLFRALLDRAGFDTTELQSERIYETPTLED